MPPHQRQPRAPQTRMKLSHRPLAAPKPTYSETIETARLQVEAYANDIFWHRIHDSNGAVRSEYQFREGDFGTAYKTLGRLLRSLGLWNVLLNPAPLDDASEEEKNERETLEAWAVNHTLPFICDSILDRWTLKRPINGRHLLEFLETTACKPFRLLELPTELRDLVYDHWHWTFPNHEVIRNGHNGRYWYAIHEKDGYDEEMSERTVEISSKHGLDSARRPIATSPPPLERTLFFNPDGHVCLSLVCQDFRDAAVERQFGRTDFDICIEPYAGDLDALFKWVNRVGIDKLRHVRNMHVTINWLWKGFFDEFDISYDPVHGLSVEHQHVENYDYPGWTTLKEHTKLISRRNIEEQWNSTGVIEFFTADPVSLREACWPLIYIPGASEGDHHSPGDYESINERDAYQVAYGRRERHCAW